MKIEHQTQQCFAAEGRVASYPSWDLSCPGVRFDARVGTRTEDACLGINGDGRVRT